MVEIVFVFIIIAALSIIVMLHRSIYGNPFRSCDRTRVHAED